MVLCKADSPVSNSVHSPSLTSSPAVADSSSGLVPSGVRSNKPRIWQLPNVQDHPDKSTIPRLALAGPPDSCLDMTLC